MASSVGSHHAVWLTVTFLLGILLHKDGRVCGAANSGVVPQAFFDYMQKQGQLLPSGGQTLGPKTLPQPNIQALATSPRPQPSVTSSPAGPTLAQGVPSPQDLLQIRDAIQQRQQALEKLKLQIQQQNNQLQQQQQQQPSLGGVPQPPLSKTGLPFPTSSGSLGTSPQQQKSLPAVFKPFQPPKSPMQQQQPVFPAPNYQFKPIAPSIPSSNPPLPQNPTAPPSPSPSLGPVTPPPLVTTREGIIDFVPADHKPAHPPPPVYGPRRHSVRGSMNTGWMARQIQPHGPVRSNQPHTWAQQNPWGAHAAPPPPLPTHHRYNHHRSPYRPRPVKKVSPFANMPMPREMQAKAMTMGRQMCITQYYESHGCIDPVRYLPPGTMTQGLFMGCSSPTSRHLCHVAGSRAKSGLMAGRGGAGGAGSNNMMMMMMMMMNMQGVGGSGSSNALLEKCLTPNTVTKAMTKMMSGGGGGATGSGMNPAAMMMMMGGGGGEGAGGGMAAMAMMNMMKRGGGARGGGAAGSSGTGSLPAGAASPRRRSGMGAGGMGMGGDHCMSVLPLIMSQGVDGGMMSAEMSRTVINMRKRMLPYTCQDIHFAVYFRMCCPGRVHPPSMMEMMSNCAS